MAEDVRIRCVWTVLRYSMFPMRSFPMGFSQGSGFGGSVRGARLTRTWSWLKATAKLGVSEFLALGPMLLTPGLSSS